MKSLDTVVTNSSSGPSSTNSLKKHHNLRKILLVGSGAVGKTSLVKVLKGTQGLSTMNGCVQEYHRTPFVELDSFPVSSMTNRDISGVFQVVDVSGQLDSQIHPLRDIAKVALGAVDVILLLFSTDNVQSLLDLARWIDIIKPFYASSKYELPLMILVKNKIDLNETIDETLIDTLMKYDDDVSRYFEVSCMTGAGFDDLCDWLVTSCFGTKNSI